MDLLQKMLSRAKSNQQRIVLPEGTEIRTLKAADCILGDQVAKVILIGNPDEINKLAAENGLLNIVKAELVDPKNHSKKELYTNLLVELRKNKGMTFEKASVLVEDPLYLGCLMIKNGDADGEVAGARNATGDVLRPAFQIVKTQPGISVVSGAFLMFLKDHTFGEDGLLIFADCAVNPSPNAAELAQIAVSTASTARNLAGFEPRVAMLSFSTKGSAKNEVVDKVVEATRLAKEMDPSILIDGEMQADAALVESVATLKAARCLNPISLGRLSSCATGKIQAAAFILKLLMITAPSCKGLFLKKIFCRSCPLIMASNLSPEWTNSSR